MVVKLLIRRPECFGPALRGEGGQGLLVAMKEAIKISEDPTLDLPKIPDGVSAGYESPGSLRCPDETPPPLRVRFSRQILSSRLTNGSRSVNQCQRFPSELLDADLGRI